MNKMTIQDKTKVIIAFLIIIIGAVASVFAN